MIATILLAVFCLLTYIFNYKMVVRVFIGTIHPLWLLVWLTSPILIPILVILVVFFHF